MKFLNPYNETPFKCSTCKLTALTYYEDDDAIVRANDVQGSLDFAYEKGEQKGGQTKATSIAINLLKTNNFSIETIAQLTGLSVAEINKLKQS